MPSLADRYEVSVKLPSAYPSVCRSVKFETLPLTGIVWIVVRFLRALKQDLAGAIDADPRNVPELSDQALRPPGVAAFTPFPPQ